MAILRRNRKLAFFSLFGISALVFLYFADVRFFRKSSSFIKFDSSNNLIEDSLDPVRYWDKKGEQNSVQQCEKIVIEEPSVDVQTEELWLDFFAPGRSPPSGGWVYPSYNESAIKHEPKLKVFVVPHSHVDPGWLKTFGDYINETNKALNNMIAYLPSHPNMTFTWMEISFFEAWWQGLADKDKEITKKLIKDGRFQITSGSWVMTDEASPYYWATIDNIVEGHQFLKRELDMIPNVMWSNDPFGYGPTVPYLFKLANINRTVIQRVHSTIKSNFGQRQMLDFYYRQFFDPTGQFDSQVHLLPYIHYDIPNTCGPNSGVCCQFDFKRITHYGCGGGFVEPINRSNLVKKAGELQEQYRLMSKIYRNNVLLVMLGDDFRYDMIEEWSQQHDNYMQLMEYMDRRPEWNIEVRFGTFNDFFTELSKRSVDEGSIDKNRLMFPSVSGDFFPYNDVGDNYWVGYFTTRPFYKRLDRVVQAMIRAADIASSLVYFSGSDNPTVSSVWFEKMRKAHRNLAIFQHHDAITGTSKWKVVADYGKRLKQALLNAAEVVSEAIGNLTGGGNELQWSQRMPQYNETPSDELISLEAGEKKQLWIFNALPHRRSELARFRVKADGCLIVRDSDGRPLTSQLNPIFNINGGVESQTEFYLLFEAKLPPLAALPYTLTRNEDSKANCAQFPKISVGGTRALEFIFPKRFDVSSLTSSQGKQMIKLENDIIATYHSTTTGYLQAIKPKVGNRESDSVLWKGWIEFWLYNDTRSGAYIFEPTSPAKPWPYNVTSVVAIYGTVTEEIHSFANCVYHKEYLRKFATVPEPDVQLNIENTIDIRNEKAVEIVIRIFNSDVVNVNSSFLTDSLGLQLMPRRFLPNHRVDMSYYPMSSQLVLQSDYKRLTLLSAQPHGATSPVAGGLEVMLDRILVMDDMKGLGYDSLIRDNVPVTSLFRLILENGDFVDSRVLSLRSQRSLQNLLYPPVTFWQNGKSKTDRQTTSYVPLQDDFPCDTLLLNIRPLEGKANDEKKKKHLLLVHRLLSDCRAINETVCKGSSRKAFYGQLTQLLKNAQAHECTLSGVATNKNHQQSLVDYLGSQSPMKSMEIKSICVH